MIDLVETAEMVELIEMVELVEMVEMVEMVVVGGVVTPDSMERSQKVMITVVDKKPVLSLEGTHGKRMLQ